MSWRDQFATIEELLHLRYGFPDLSRVQPIDPAIHILKTPKVLQILGYLKSPTTLNLTSNALHFITLMVLHSYDGDFVPISNTTTPLTILSLNHLCKSSHLCKLSLLGSTLVRLTQFLFLYFYFDACKFKYEIFKILWGCIHIVVKSIELANATFCT